MKYAWREVPRAPDSLYYYSVQLSPARFSSPHEGWHVILFNYVIRVIRTGPRRCDGDRGQIDRTNGGGGGGGRKRQEDSVPFSSSHELATPYLWVSVALSPALRAQPLWNCSYSINFTPGANYHKIIGSPPSSFVRARGQVSGSMKCFIANYGAPLASYDESTLLIIPHGQAFL